MLARLTIICLVFLIFGLSFARFVQTERRARWTSSGITSCAPGSDRSCRAASF